MPPRLCNRHTSWDQFQTYINEKNCLNITLNDKQELEEATEYITKLIQETVTICTPIIKKQASELHYIPLQIKELVHEKRRARRRWQNTRNSQDRTYLNRLTHNLQAAIRQIKNETINHFVSKLAVGDHTIWKATKKFKRPTVAIPPLRKQDRSWARSTSEKSVLFAEHLASVFTPNSDNSNDNDLEAY
jgi:hypothetical protein